MTMTSRYQRRPSPFASTVLCPLWMLALLLMFNIQTTAFAAAAVVEDNYKPSSWYERYDSYPAYCSTPEEMQTRKIPPLQDQTTNTDDSVPKLGETRLVHVTTILRHGARTPWAGASELKCWDGFWEDPETGVWDCDLTTILAPPNPDKVLEEEGDDTKTTTSTEENKAMFLFEKKYDALVFHPSDNDDDDETNGRISNELNGTCQLGQLILQGYEQEMTNGQFLREAYLFDSTSSSKFKHDERMRLLDTSFAEYSPWDTKHIRLRSDDDQRTLMSGQVVLRGMLGPEVVKEFERTGIYPTIPVHTADYSRDIVAPNPEVCPRLKLLAEMAEQSAEYQHFNNSLETQGIRDYMSQELGTSQVEMDCLMTTMCTDRKLPKAIDDYTDQREISSWFRTIAEFESKKYNLLITYNDGDYAKLAMSFLWSEIMDNISKFLHGDVMGEGASLETSAPKLALFAAHDSTLVPLLASLGPNLWNSTAWPPYASMMIIEIHEIINDGRNDRNVYRTPFAFRLIYNGKVITPLVDGCPSNADLCDARHLTERVDNFARRDLDCSLPEKQTNEVLRDAATVLSSATGILIFVGLMAASGLLGALVTFVALTGRLPNGRKVVGPASADKYGQIALTTRRGGSGGTTNKGFSDEPSEEF